MSTEKLDVTDLDFDQIKDNLKSFLGNQTVFSGYDFTASGINTILNVLAYNTHYNSFYLNMIANEMYLGSASIRNSVASKAAMLNYTPRSQVGASATIIVTVVPAGTPSFVTCDKFTKFNSTIKGKQYVFATTQAFQIDRSLAGAYVKQIDVKEGVPSVYTFTKDTSDKEQRFVLPNSNVDISTAEVTIKVSPSDATSYAYEKAGDFTAISGTANIYFTSEVSNGRYEIQFGDGSIGRALTHGNQVQVRALVCNGAGPNGASTFKSLDAVGGFDNISISTSTAAYGGAERESIESVKFNAPKTFSSQRRAVTVEDYKALIFANFPDAESIQSWGGETSATPVYGKVYIAIKPKGAEFLTTAQRKTVIALLSDRKMVAIEPVITDPIIYKVQPTITVKYDSALTTGSSSAIAAKVKTTVQNYNSTDLRLFDTNFKFSKLLTKIDKSDESITNSLMTLKIYTSFIPSLLTAVTYRFYFNNAIAHAFDGYLGAISSSSFSYKDTAGTLYDACKMEDYNGVIRVYRKQNNIKTIIRNNIGSIDYTTGQVTLVAFAPQAITNNIVHIYFEPVEEDMIPVREQIFQILDSDITVNVTDVNILERRSVTANSTTTTTTSY